MASGPGFEPTRISRPASELDRPSGPRPAEPPLHTRTGLREHTFRDFEHGAWEDMEVCLWHEAEVVVGIVVCFRPSSGAVRLLDGHNDGAKKQKKTPIYEKKPPTSGGEVQGRRDCAPPTISGSRTQTKADISVSPKRFMRAWKSLGQEPPSQATSFCEAAHPGS